MTANVHTRLPDGEKGHLGERRLAEHLSIICGPQFDLWFSVDYLPGVTDLDLLICERSSGFFAIEVKAVPLSAVVEYSASHMSIRGRRSDRHPLKQARYAQIKLSEYLRSVNSGPPFIYVTAAFPLISRSAFIKRFGGVPSIALQAEGMLFSEDLVNASKLSQRLREAARNPPFSSEPRKHKKPDPSTITKMIHAIDPEGKPTPSPADIARAAVFNAPVHRSDRLGARIATFAEPGQREPTVFRGYPGTGKTFVLLRIALEHARAGRSVLFVCYNKVLAGDICRMLSTTGIPTKVTSKIDVVHAWALRKRYFHKYVAGGDEAALREVEQMIQFREEPLKGIWQEPLNEYVTVCVDEAQDLPEFAFRLIEWHTRAGTEWFLAHGPGQELYGNGTASFMADLLSTAEENKRIEQFNRVYRTAHIDFLVAQGIFENAPHLDKISRWVTKHPISRPKAFPGKEGVQSALFDKPLDAAFESEGQLPKIVVVPVPQSGTTVKDLDVRRDVLRKVLMEELSAAAEEGRPGDVAILLRNVRDERDADDARAVLEDLSVPYIDQIKPINRDLMLPAGHVRLVSFKSARGIEAHRTILIGLDLLQADTPDTLRDSRNQAYIALSRAKVRTTVLTRPHQRHEFGDFLDALVKEYERTAPWVSTPSTPPTRIPNVPRQPVGGSSSHGVIVRVVEDRGFGFIRTTNAGEDVFFHESALLGMVVEGSVGRKVWFTSVLGARGEQATIVAEKAPSGTGITAQPGYESGYVSVRAQKSGLGYLLIPRLAKRVAFHVNQMHVNQTTGDKPLSVGDRVDVMLDEDSLGMPRAVLVVPRTIGTEHTRSAD